MLTAEELYFLNETTDNKEIYGLKSDKFWKKEGKEKKKIIQSMISKNILTPIGDINLNTIFIIEALNKYKNADKYVWINGEITSLDDTMECVYLKLKENNEVVLKQAFKSSIIMYIIKSYEFLLNDLKKDKSSKKTEMSLEEFLNSGVLNLNEDKILYLRKEMGKMIVMYRAYFTFDNKLYRYDALDQSIENISSKEARIEIAEFYEV